MADRQLYLGQDKIVGAGGGVVRFDSAQSLTYDQQKIATNNMGTQPCVFIDLGKRPTEPSDSGTLSNENRLKIINKDTPFIAIGTQKNGMYYTDYYQKMWEDNSNIAFGYYNWPYTRPYFYSLMFVVNKNTGVWNFKSKTIISQDKNELIIDTGYTLMDNATVQMYVNPKTSTYFVFDSHATMPKMYVWKFTSSGATRSKVWNPGSGSISLESITSVTTDAWAVTFKANGSSRARFYSLVRQKG